MSHIHQVNLEMLFPEFVILLRLFLFNKGHPQGQSIAMYYLLVLCINLALKSFQFIDCTFPFVFFITPKILSLSITLELKIYIYMVLCQPIQQLWIFTPLPMVGAFPKMIQGRPIVITAQNVLFWFSNISITDLAFFSLQ